MIHYVKTRKCIKVDNTVDNILYVGNKWASFAPFITNKQIFYHKGYIKRVTAKYTHYIIDTEYPFKCNRKNSITSDMLYLFCSNIRQFKINGFSK
jgi:hypothetical protein